MAVSHLVFSNQLGRREDQRLLREDTILVEVYLCIMLHLMAHLCKLQDEIKELVIVLIKYQMLLGYQHRRVEVSVSKKIKDSVVLEVVDFPGEVNYQTKSQVV